MNFIILINKERSKTWKNIILNLLKKEFNWFCCWCHSIQHSWSNSRHHIPSNEVTYDNQTSNLQSNNVQGAIDELYYTCSDIQPQL